MVNSIIRLALILVFLILGVILHIKLGIQAAWYLYAASVILMITHLIFGTVWSAFYYLRKGKIERADQLLRQVVSPGLLIPRHRAYYFFVKGMVLLQRHQLPEAAVNLEQAVDLGLQSDKDTAIARLNLAHIAWVQKDVEKSQKHLAVAKQMETSDLLIKDNIKKLEQALANSAKK